MKKFTSLFILSLLFPVSCSTSSTTHLDNNISDNSIASTDTKVQYIELDEKMVCPSGMMEVTGNYCPSVVQECLNLDTKIHNVNGYVRCLEFNKSKCLTPENKRPYMHFCMDTFEYPNQEGVKPSIMISWYDMKKNCESQGKRLCQDHEWTLACEGPEMLPYPYGYVREPKTCNIDHPQIAGYNAYKDKLTPDLVDRLDQRVSSGEMPACTSPFGIHDMTGNVDEWVVNSSGHPYQSGLMGGHWVIGARNRCRPETLAHAEATVFYEMGGRCCKDIH